MPGMELEVHMPKQLYWPYWILPILLVLLISPWSAAIDLNMSHYFFSDGHFESSPLLNFAYKYGLLPFWIGFVAGIGMLFNQKWRLGGIYLILVMAIGSGFIINVALKGHWGRPRPKQVVQFGGDQEFRAFYQPYFNNPIPSKSFPSGHASSGFYFFSVILLGSYYRNKFLRNLGILLTLLLGGVLSYARIAQGGHFFTDTLFSALIMWLTALLLYYVVFKK
jgi:lipid A 4'-phosphatase